MIALRRKRDVGDWFKKLITDSMNKVENIMILSPKSGICHHHKVTNITEGSCRVINKAMQDEVTLLRILIVAVYMSQNEHCRI